MGSQAGDIVISKNPDSAILSGPDGVCQAEVTQGITSIAQIVHLRAKHQPDHVALVFLDNGEREAAAWSYHTLCQRACAIAASLSEVARPGDRAVILHEPGPNYVAAFIGCLHAGITAVTCTPPQGRRAVRRLYAIIDDAKPSAILTSAAIRSSEFKLRGEHWRRQKPDWIETDELGATEHPLTAPAINQHPALLQYTSGSTGNPKGVVISHANLLANSRAATQWLGIDPHRKGVSWLPPFHDMGLMGGVIQPLYEGFPVYLMTPAHFIQRPVRWLRAISKYRLTATGAPNFAYDLCVDQIEDAELSGIDLSCLEVAFCGSEPVNVATLKRFAERFSRWGFDINAFNPCYGMAEATLLVSGKPRGTAPVFRQFDSAGLQRGEARPNIDSANARELCGCGKAVADTRICITDPNPDSPDNHEVLAKRQIGEIRVAGPTIGEGYWQREAESDETFNTRLPDSDRHWMRTGDLGFLDEDGELFITGRIKDLIIIAGANHYPQDIEATVRYLDPAIHAGGVVAVGIPVDQEEAVALAIELRRGVSRPDPRELRQRVISAVTREHGVRPAAVIFSRVGTLARTTSGKIQRHACREALLSGELGDRPLFD